MYVLTAALSGIFMTVGAASAEHSWGSFHWARTANPLVLRLGDNLSSSWKPYLSTTSTDWSGSSVLDTQIVRGSTTGRRCQPSAGKIEVCNATYGKNGWLGIASVWASDSHITQATVKLNDTYFNTTQYSNPAWKNLVMCQEVGHAFGLDHQDEDSQNLPIGSCMDYSNDPAPNQHPNQHDFDQLETIYAHLDGFDSAAKTTGVAAQAQAGEPGDWGKLVRQDGKTAVFERDLGNGRKLFTFVIYA